MTTPRNAADAADDSGSDQAEERLQSPHDRLINQTLQQIDAARDLLARHLPGEIAEHLQMETLQPVDTSFIDRNLRRRFVDRLFSVQLTEQIVSSLDLRSSHVYIFVLVDHKST